MLRSVIAACLLLCATPALAGTPLVEITAGKKVYTGKELVRNDKQIVLQGQDGRVQLIEPKDVAKRRSIGEFRPLSGTIVRDRLMRELGSGFASASTRHY